MAVCRTTSSSSSGRSTSSSDQRLPMHPPASSLYANQPALDLKVAFDALGLNELVQSNSEHDGQGDNMEIFNLNSEFNPFSLPASTGTTPNTSSSSTGISPSSRVPSGFDGLPPIHGGDENDKDAEGIMSTGQCLAWPDKSKSAFSRGTAASIACPSREWASNPTGELYYSSTCRPSMPRI
jgi:hypothetical protein